jgi:phosphoribosyl 1,2-cyclic phosphodiesterase
MDRRPHLGMKIAVLGSGSRGNATLLASGGSAILIDAGLSARQLDGRLEAVGFSPEGILAIVITHEHRDHTQGMGVFARRHGTPLYVTEATQRASLRLLRGSERIHTYRPGYHFEVGDFSVEPFLTAHDAADPVAVAVTGSCGTRVGIATDLGRPTAGIRHALAGCDFLVLEANHDERLLRSGPYPSSVQARIAGSHGHLSNRAAASFALELLHPRLTGIILAHLSGDCNRPDLARKVVMGTLRKAGWKGFMGVAEQDAPTPLIDIRELRLDREAGQLSLF